MATKSVTKLDALDQLALADPKEIIALLLWKDRHRNPEMTVQFTEKDIAGFKACVEYLEVVPKVRIQRPQGLPAQEAIPAEGNRRAIAARAAEPPRPFVVVQVVDAKGDSIKPIENDEEGAQLRDQAETLRRHRDGAAALANQLIADARSGNFSSSMVIEAAESLKALARA